MYFEGVDAVLKYLLRSQGNYYWFGDKVGANKPTDTFHHLTCFTGTFMLLPTRLTSFFTRRDANNGSNDF